MQEKNITFHRKLIVPKELKEMFPLTEDLEKIKSERDEIIKNIITGNDNRMLLLIGPCSADREDAVLDYITRLIKVQEKVKDKNVILNDGYCPIHHFFDAGEVERLKSEHPSAKVLAHPECRREVLDKADYIGSTSGIIAYTSESKNNEFIICTERGVLGELRKNNPEKHFYFADKGRVCEDMKLNTLEKLRDALKFNRYTVEVDEEIRKGALKPLDRMLEMAQ